MPVRLADYVARFVESVGVRHVFLITGGGAMHLNDAFGRSPGLTCIPLHHEQSCAIAAEAYCRLHNRPAVVNVTTGPGGTNAVTGVFGAYVDSIAMLVISGQSRFDTLVASTDLPLRQLGDQEVDIVRMASGITKYAVMVTDPQSIRFHLEKAWHLATTGRPGPVWVDIPMNVQGAMIEPDALTGYDPREDAIRFETALEPAVDEVAERLRTAQRPVIYAGTGIRLSEQYETFLNLAETWGVPVVTAWNSNDLLWDEHPCYVGRPGSVGTRPGNFAAQNADFLLVLGCRLNIRLVSYNWRSFARAAYLAQVDVDAAELRKPTVRPHLPIHADLRDFLPALARRDSSGGAARHAAWLAWCKQRLQRYPVVLPEYWQAPAEGVNPYCFVDALFAQLPEGQTVVTGDGTACVVGFQAARIRRGQRLFSNSGSAPMGFDIPAAIGAHYGSGGASVVCLAGDGSAMMNIQELAVIAGRRLPIKIYILNNQGYHSIRQTQQNFFADNIVGCGPDSGLPFPDFGRLAAGFDLPFRRIAAHGDLQATIAAAQGEPGPMLCEVMLDLRQPFAPKLSSKRLPDGRMVTAALEDMTPLLSPEELRSNLLIPPWEGS